MGALLAALESQNFQGEHPQTSLQKTIPFRVSLKIHMHPPRSLALRTIQTFLSKPILVPVKDMTLIIAHVHFNICFSDFRT